MAKTHLVEIAAYVVLLLGPLTGCGNEHATSAVDDEASAIGESTSARREIVLSVPDMNCPMCPITVRRALAGVDGVYEAEASLEGKQARAVFDPARTDVEVLIAAVAETGFSATLQESDNE